MAPSSRVRFSLLWQVRLWSILAPLSLAAPRLAGAASAVSQSVASSMATAEGGTRGEAAVRVKPGRCAVLGWLGGLVRARPARGSALARVASARLQRGCCG